MDSTTLILNKYTTLALVQIPKEQPKLENICLSLDLKPINS